MSYHRNIISLALVCLIFFAGCSMKDSLDIDLLKTPEKVHQFQKDKGKIGAYALRPILAKASLYLNRPLKELETIAQTDAGVTKLKNGAKLALDEGVYIAAATDADNNSAYIGTMTFRNNTPGKAVLLLETINDNGESQGFNYVELDSGDMYETKHNASPGLGIFIWFREILGIGTGTVGAQKDSLNIQTAKLEDAFAKKPRCRVIKTMIIRNRCIGPCVADYECKASEYENYFYFGKEPKTCGCQ